MPLVTMPNGDQVSFPDDMPKTEIKALILKKFPDLAPSPAIDTGAADFGLPVPEGAQGQEQGEAFWREQERIGAERKAAEEAALNESYGEMDLGQRVGTFAENTLEGVPILGPAIQRGADALLSETVGRAQGYDPAMTRDILEQNRQIRESRAPVEAIAGNLTGAAVSMGKLAQTGLGKQALGIEGKNAATRYATGIATNAGISGADTLARGGTLRDAAGSAAIGGGVTAVMPAVSTAVRGVGDKIRQGANFMKGSYSPVSEATRRVGLAHHLDEMTTPQGVMSQADEAAARLNQQPVMNVDRGGETTRALARSAANTSPDFRGQIEKTVSDRFGTQSQRAIKTLTRVAGGNVDDIQYQNSIKELARMANKPAYNKAYSSKEAQAMWNDEFARIMQSPDVKRAVRTAERSGANRAVSEGIKPINNPFVFGKDGAVSLKKATDGSTALPNLRFWDQVQRDLRKIAESAGRGSAKFNEVEAVRKTLNGALDDAVPAFRDARVGAAGFFGAENALDAGRKFAKNMRLMPEAKQAFSAMNKAEQKAFVTGYTSDIIDAIKATSDRSNIIQSKFGNPAARELNEFVLGKPAARELEAFVRVEVLIDRMRGALGNSTTARQLAELGMAGGAGTGVSLASGQDWQTSLGIGMVVAAGKRGASALGSKIDERILKEVGRILMSTDPELIAKAQFNAANSSKWMKALEAYGVGLEKAMPVLASRSQPLQ